MKHVAVLLILSAFILSCTQADKSSKSDLPGEPSTFLSTLADSVWNTIETGGKTICADGSDYYFLVRKGAPDKVIIYFQGGGACWDSYTCSNPIDTIEPNFYLKSISPNMKSNQGIFDASNPENPFQDWTIVAIPYCTGDVHLGNIDQQYPLPSGDSMTIYHRGMTNTNAVFDWMKAQKIDPAKIFLSGTSAGGYASIAYVDDVYQKFENAKIYQLTDCSVLVTENATAMADPWNATPLLEHGLGPNKDLINATYQALGSTFNDDRVIYSQINSMYDEVMFFYYMVMQNIEEPSREDVAKFASSRIASIAETDAKIKNHFVFSTDFNPNDRGMTPHTFISSDRFYTAEEDGIPLIDWVRALVTDELDRDIMVDLQ